MPSVKLLIDDLVVYDSTSNATIADTRDPTITMNDLQLIENPVEGSKYYYISPLDSKIYQGTLVRVNYFGSIRKQYTMMSEYEELILVNAIYVRKILKRGGKRKTRRINKRKRSTKRRRRSH